MLKATLAYGVSRQTLLQRVKRGELGAVLSAPDAEKACVSSLQPPQKDCFDHDNQRKEQCGTASKKLAISNSTTN